MTGKDQNAALNLSHEDLMDGVKDLVCRLDGELPETKVPTQALQLR